LHLVVDLPVGIRREEGGQVCGRSRCCTGQGGSGDDIDQPRSAGASAYLEAIEDKCCECGAIWQWSHGGAIGSSSSGTISTSMQPQLPHPSALLLHNTQVNSISFLATSGSDVHAIDLDHQEHRRPWLPKMDFPHFDGSDAHIWVDKCMSYFAMYQIPVGFRVSMTSIHMSGPATHWF
jgi:hypothetical protein